MRDSARIVIIGGGAIGCSIAYHLAQAGEKDVVLLEKSGLTHGATWHAAGLVGQLRSNRNLTKMMQYSTDLYSRLSGETEVETDWKQVGSLRLASTEQRWLEIQRAHGQARAFGLDIELISASEAKHRFPLIEENGVIGAAFIAKDGHIDPSGLTQAYARGARNGGVEIIEGVLVEDLIVENGRVSQVVTNQGTIKCESVVNAAGLWARRVAKMAGLSIPAGVVQHQYMVTEKGLPVDSTTPTLRDPDNNYYAKPEVGGLAIGGWEPRPAVVHEKDLPFDFGQELFGSNFDQFESIAVAATDRLPILNETGIQNLINGPIPISADGEPIMGPVPGLPNVFLACGFTSGIAASGGAGLCMANWIINGDPGMDLWAFDVRRFGPHHATDKFMNERAQEAYSKYYAIHYPGDEMETARDVRRSPLHRALQTQGAVDGTRFGWERPNWFAPAGTRPYDTPTFERANWFDHVGHEHQAVRERVALIDQTSFSKFEMTGPDALKSLQWIAAADIDKPVGSAIYTQLLNHNGGIEADLTIMRTGEKSFYIVTGSAFGIRDFDWINSNLPDGADISLRNVTSSRAVINLCGPFSRKVLEKVCDEDVSNGAFPYMQCRDLTIGYASVLAIRLTYVGELGWELHLPMEYALHVYEVLHEAGREFDILNVGYRAIDTLRMEKRYLYWSRDISPDYTPLEAGLGFCVALGKKDFLGAKALEKQKAEGIKQKLCCFLLDGTVTVHGGEAIVSNDKVIGITTSGNYGHTVGKNIVLGYLSIEDAAKDNFQIECFGNRIEVKQITGAPYDPERTKVLNKI